MTQRTLAAPALPADLYRAGQVRELDRIAIQERGIPGYTLMNRAGWAVFDAVKSRFADARRLVVVCGKGNNAGDGYVVARLARQAGLDVHVLHLSDPGGLQGDALTAYQDAETAGVPMQSFDPALLAAAEVIVDAIFGTGLERDVEGAWAEAIERINAQPARVVAVDIPSGLHADRGAILGAAVRADVTVSFIALKQGLFSGQGPDCCGEILFNDLRVPADIFADINPSCLRYAGEDLERLLPRRSRSSHKGHNGHVLVVGGDHGMGGAARMAAEAAARCGAGLTSIATRAGHAALQAAMRPELMFHGVDDPEALQPLLERATVVAVGPGLGRGDWGRAMLAAVLAAGRPIVADADALNLLAEQPMQRDDWVLTPHPGEAGRLLGISTSAVQADRFKAVAELAGRYGGACVLKGAGSLVAAPGDPLVLCSAGNPGMGSGGMGDVLTGVIASLLGQGLTLAAAARAGVYVHARAADLAAEHGERGMLALDLLPHLRQLVNPQAP
ncbi:MAG: NAD(P)H-hydrate dehydratase [Pseudomonadota bacterium]|nr:NAD(P)H-hydrate dehydratase [Pseudomonadota bacterium]